MAKRILLSIITVNMNDEYHENQLQRTKFILNYLIYSLRKMDAINLVEYLIVDWGSSKPFSSYFSEELSMCSAIKFINVPKKETAKCDLSFDVSKALNIGIENSSGEHVMLTGSDQFFPLSTFNNILNMLEKPETYGLTGNEYKLVPRKFLKDDFFIYHQNMKSVDLYFQSLMHSSFPYPNYPLNGGAGAGGNLLKREQLLRIGGIKDTKPHNSGQDRVLFHETSQICSHIDTANFGSFLLKLPRTESISRKKKIKHIESNASLFEFGKFKNLMDPINIEILDGLNLPTEKLFFDIKPPIEKSKYTVTITIIEALGAIIDCTSLIYSHGFKLKSQDINFIHHMKKNIKKHKLKNIILDEGQSIRFTKYLTRVFPDIKIIIILHQNTSLDILKFRAEITEMVHFSKNRHYGHIQIVYFEKEVAKSINELNNICIMQDFSGDTQFCFENEFSSYEINATRSNIPNTKEIIYSITGGTFFDFENSKRFVFDSFIGTTIDIVITFRKATKLFKNLKRKLKNKVKRLII